MKKLLTLLVSGLMLLSLAACSPKKEEVVDNPTGPKTVKVGVSIYQFDDAFMTLYRNEIKAYFDTLSNDEVKYEVDIQNGKNDQAEQSAQIDNFIANKVDVLIINLVQATAAQTVIEKCEAAGIPVVFINREPSEDDMKLYAGKMAYVGADARQSGRMQGQLISDLADKGDLNGDGKLSYVMIMGDVENVDAKYRTQFSIEQYIEDTGMEVVELARERGEWSRSLGQELAATALANFGSEIEVIFCNNDDMALGALESIKAAGRTVGTDIYLVGVDALAEAVAAVEAGEMTGTVLNDHVGQSHTAVDAAVKAVNGDTLDAYYWVDYVKVTK